MVIATQNPIEQAGTYRLPEAQLDRFLMKTSVGYPDHEATIADPRRRQGRATGPAAQPVVTAAASSSRWPSSPTRCYVDPAMLGYVTRIAEASRRHPSLKLGLSVRGCLAYVRCAKTWAACAGPHLRRPRRHQDARRAGAVATACCSTPRPSSPGRRSSRSSTRSSATSRRRSRAAGRLPVRPRAPVCRPPPVCQQPPDPRVSRSGPTRRSCSGRRRATTRRPSAPCTGPRTRPGSTPRASTRIPRTPVRPRVADRSS